MKVSHVKVSRKRFIAVKDNRTKVLMDIKIPTWSNGKQLTRQEQIEYCWRPFSEIKQARILSWSTKNTAIAALKQSYYTENINYEIVEMTETFEV